MRTRDIAVLGAITIPLTVLLVAIFANLKGFESGMSEAIAEVWVGVKMLFFTGFVLGVVYVVIRLRQMSKVHEVRPGPHGAVQAVVVREAGGIQRVEHLSSPMADPMQQLALLEKIMKVASVSATTDQRMLAMMQKYAVTEQERPQIPQATEASRPTIDEIVKFVKRNSYEIVLGRSLQTREFITEELVDAHIKLIGGSRMGKSCEAGAIIDQVRQTHDCDHLQIALLDLEYKTSRLFENDEHIMMVNTGYKKVKMHAKSVAQVADCLICLHDVMMQRYELTDTEVDRLPRILIYLEEFLYWKKLLGQFVADDVRERALASFAGLATRGLKVGLHLMACAQVDYADEELKDAMAQFLAINVAFSVKPSAAQAAGFVNSELLKRNYEARTKGQFVVESIGGADIGMAPDYDVKAKLQRAQAETTVAELPEKEGYEPQPNYSRITGRIEVDPALQAKVAQVMENPGENMNDCIQRVWGARAGDNAKYKQAKQEYVQVKEIIHSMARRGMEFYQMSEYEGV